MAVAVTAQLQGTIVGVFVEVGTPVRAGQVVALVESMKMHHEITAPSDGVVESVAIADGDTITAGQPVLHLDDGALVDDGAEMSAGPAAGPLGLEREDLREVIERHAVGLDANRPEAVAGAAPAVGALPVRTWPTSSTTAPSSSTGRS
jgi:pyruvate/2-oxoglutarate dehydrogenase complex dihydrolipoamide acyltransferase (E2) component